MAKKEKKAKKQAEQETKPAMSQEQLEEGKRILAQAKKNRKRKTAAQQIVERGKQTRRGRRRITLEGRNAIAGYCFILPWIIGFLLFFLGPLIDSARYAFSDVTLGGGETGTTGFIVTGVGMANFVKMFTTDAANFVERYSSTLLKLVYNLPVITLLSLFIALILNQKFKGRTVARAIFFMPVILASGAVISSISSNMSVIEGTRGEESSALFSAGMNYIYTLMGEMHISEEIITYIRTMIDNIFNTIWLSGIQILLFLGALQTIPTSFYEASAIEGASGWVTFWKITFPIVSPYILVTVVYTAVDSFTDMSDQSVLKYITTVTASTEWGYASAMAWVFFLTIALILGLLMLLLNKIVFYQVD
nr:sugar ABC transporter permease [bacterium]